MKILVVYYSMFGHVLQLAQAAAAGAQSVPGAEVVLRRVEDLPFNQSELQASQHAQATLEQQKDIPVCTLDDLKTADGILFGTPTRFGNMAAQMRDFLDQTGGLWVKGALVGKVGSVFASTGTGARNESPIISFVTTLMHHVMVYVGLPYACPDLADISEVKGGSPWGAATRMSIGGRGFLPTPARDRLQGRSRHARTGGR